MTVVLNLNPDTLVALWDNFFSCRIYRDNRLDNLGDNLVDTATRIYRISVRLGQMIGTISSTTEMLPVIFL